MTTSREVVVNMLQGSNPIEFPGAVMCRLLGPMVYVVFRSDHVLYVGMSRQGVGRFTRQHPAMSRVEDGDTIQCFPMPDRDTARKLEALLIKQLRPQWNMRRGLGDHRQLAERMGITAQSAYRMSVECEEG